MIALWTCVAYFAFLIIWFASDVLWGGLGLLRPDMIEDGKVSVETVANIVNHFQGLFKSLYGLMFLGFIFLVFTTILISKKRIEA